MARKHITDRNIAAERPALFHEVFNQNESLHQARRKLHKISINTIFDARTRDPPAVLCGAASALINAGGRQ
jgi:hypothetical protein